jgi:hypothetical protein|tara:strand:- start:614 stop:874 length:261 start_codon:yes stop_codon:yes gene_type:complete
MDNFDTRKWFKKQYLEEAQIKEFDTDNVDRLMISLARLVDDMKSRLRTIDTELRAEPELDYKVREMEMDLKSLDHKLDVVKEKLSL